MQLIYTRTEGGTFTIALQFLSVFLSPERKHFRYSCEKKNGSAFKVERMRKSLDVRREDKSFAMSVEKENVIKGNRTWVPAHNFLSKSFSSI
jgi:hypothetical protein